MQSAIVLALRSLLGSGPAHKEQGFRREVVLLLLLVAASLFLLRKPVPAGVAALGVVAGSALSLQATGVVLVYRSNRFVNFAQLAVGATAGGLFVLFAKYQPALRGLQEACPPCLPSTSGVVADVNYWVSAALALVTAVLLSYGTYRLVVRRFDKAPRLVVTVATVFLSVGLPGIVTLAANRLTTREQKDEILDLTRAQLPFDVTIDIAPVQLHTTDLLLVVAAVGIVASLYAYFRLSPMGNAIQAAADNPRRAETLGLDVTRVTGRVWIIAGLLSGVAGLLAAMSVQGAGAAGLDINTLVQILTVTVIARMTSLPMTVFAAICLGIVRQAVLFAYGSSTPFDAGLFLVIALVLLLQRDTPSRSESSREGSWQLSRELRPIPSVLKPLPTVRTWTRVLTALVAALVLSYPWFMSPSQTNLGALVLIYAVIGLSLLVLTGWAGQISLGQMAFAAVGGYVAVVSGLPFPLSLLAGAVAGGVVAVIVGLPALSLRGLNLAISTLAFAVATNAVLLNPNALGSALPSTVARPRLFGMDLRDERLFYYVSLLCLTAAVLAVAGLRRSRTGRVLLAAKENENAVQAFGINLMRTRLTAFAVSGALAAFAGALYAYHQYGVTPSAYSPDRSLTVFLMAVIGGLGAIAGPLLGAVYQGVLLLFGTTPLVAQLATGFGGVLLLMLVPGGISKAVWDIRDAGLRRVASRNRVLVPSLLADRKAEDAEDRAPILPKLRPSGGTAFVARRYELLEQDVLDAGRMTLAPEEAAAAEKARLQGAHT